MADVKGETHNPKPGRRDACGRAHLFRMLLQPIAFLALKDLGLGHYSYIAAT